MKARITAFDWNGELQLDFGAEGSLCELPDSSEELFKLLGPHGRFSIYQPGEKDGWNRPVSELTVCFENERD